MGLFRNIVGALRDSQKRKRKPAAPWRPSKALSFDSHGGGRSADGRAIPSTMTPYEEGYTDGYKGRANRYAPDSANVVDHYHDPKKFARNVKFGSAEYRAGYRKGNADGKAERPWDESR